MRLTIAELKAFAEKHGTIEISKGKHGAVTINSDGEIDANDLLVPDVQTFVEAGATRYSCGGKRYGRREFEMVVRGNRGEVDETEPA
jgi:hypothetical protein